MYFKLIFRIRHTKKKTALTVSDATETCILLQGSFPSTKSVSEA